MKLFEATKKFKRFYLIAIVIIVAGLAIARSQFFTPAPKLSEIPVQQRAISIIKEPIQPIPLHIDLNLNKVALGEKLFNETKLSHNNNISCASCHNLKTGGTDNLVYSFSTSGTFTLVNTPTIFNVGFNFRQFWDGRSETLEEQIDGPLNSSHEMGSNWPEIISKLKQDPNYVSTFKQLYQDSITRENTKDALATFMRSLYTPNSRFDKYLRGDTNAITNEEKKGYSLFKNYGCISCHQGINVGGNMFQKFGILNDYFANRGNITKSDSGRANITQEPSDDRVFKVPSLRNVELTAPYFHDGSTKSLENAVTVMAKYQLGRTLSKEEIALIIKFLKTLTGEYQGKSLSSY
ncbi:cytochrome B6 [Oscillatoriales cyanobacterium USR001]|nr:cytochrome B6 [Oscillatoriales cyanobacterium USR001]